MSDWTKRGKAKARIVDARLEVEVDGLTTQGRYYKRLLRDLFRKDFRLRPGYGDWSVEITMIHSGPPPRIDLDNLAKALLDCLTGFAFEDDSQVARLLVTRQAGDRDQVRLTAAPL